LNRGDYPALGKGLQDILNIWMLLVWRVSDDLQATRVRDREQMALQRHPRNHAACPEERLGAIGAIQNVLCGINLAARDLELRAVFTGSSRETSSD
jgi:hypothetical protein